MKPDELRAKLEGVVAFPVTTFKPDLTLDLKGLRSNVEALVAHSVCAVVAPAGTGELFSLTPAEQMDVFRSTMEVVDGKTPVLIGVGVNQPLAIAAAKEAAAAGASGILAFPPYYPMADARGLVDYYKSIAEATDLGLIVYSRDWAVFKPSEVETLAHEIPQLIAWKDGQGDMRRYQAIINRLGNRLHWIGGAGDDLVPAYYSLGIRTYTSSIANVAPKLSLELHRLASQQDTETLPHLMDSIVTPLYEMRARRKGYEVSVMKSLMDMLGLVGGPCRPPLPDVTADEEKELRKTLALWKQWI